ncbi:hypothetical protein L9W92_08125 [Pelotomaculum terephthalicicum JT]|uniref:hypothetical protein n=1 Tax=Pelotomaculum TaxID=191373 RepID=UPI0009D279E3|nr:MULTISPECIES: hypothetical protein [Pelotomaculum]MCG9968021.1 hypothetical protein [Pelotomaculum terephthalicicum JT]OPX87516.1 MAG: hypothetical protein A4E54_01630 [Pelotomaculum sp. PtaB.Bin117]OPY60628.1 MAG: hypothetical protein A4E56_02570 [Pelotomaculum sp. PtaU1.Bin065]
MRILSAVIAGLAAGLLFCLLVFLASPKAAFPAFLIAWFIFSLLFYRKAESSGKIWSRACLAAGAECLAIPLASWFLPFFCGQQAVQAAKQNAYNASQAFGSAFGGGLINMLAGYAGILIGLLLIFIAYLSLKPVRR